MSDAPSSGKRPRVCVVVKRTSWEKWVEEEPDDRTRELLVAGDESVSRVRASHADHVETLQEVRTALEELGASVTWSDKPHAFRTPDDTDLVVIVGGDGTLLAASHGVGSTVPLLGVNSSPAHSVGFFCGASKGDVRTPLRSALDGTLLRLELTRMQVELNERLLHGRVLNEVLFCHASPAATSRYILRVIGSDGPVGEEDQKSSGVWIGPAAGSTAAQRSAGGSVLPLTSTELQYVVREPYRPHDEILTMTVGLIAREQAVSIKSRMHKACLFIDGEHLAYDVAIGDVVTMRRSKESLVVLGLSRKASAADP